MAGWKEVATDYLIAKLTGGVITSASKLVYKTRYELADLPLDGVVTKYLLQTLIPSFPFKDHFTGVSAITSIDWQTDIPAGHTQTYSALLGNVIRGMVWTGNSPNWIKTDATISVITDTDDETILFVTIDWGFTSDGYIQW